MHDIVQASFAKEDCSLPILQSVVAIPVASQEANRGASAARAPVVYAKLLAQPAQPLVLGILHNDPSQIHAILRCQEAIL